MKRYQHTLIQWSGVGLIQKFCDAVSVYVVQIQVALMSPSASPQSHAFIVWSQTPFGLAGHRKHPPSGSGGGYKSPQSFHTARCQVHVAGPTIVICMVPPYKRPWHNNRCLLVCVYVQKNDDQCPNGERTAPDIVRPSPFHFLQMDASYLFLLLADVLMMIMAIHQNGWPASSSSSGHTAHHPRAYRSSMTDLCVHCRFGGKRN